MRDLYNFLYTIQYSHADITDNILTDGWLHERSQNLPRVQKWSLMAWVGVIPKEGWALVAAPTLLLVWHRLFKKKKKKKKKINKKIYEKIYKNFPSKKSVSYNDSGHKGPFCVTLPNILGSKPRCCQMFIFLMKRLSKNWILRKTEIYTPLKCDQSNYSLALVTVEFSKYNLALVTVEFSNYNLALVTVEFSNYNLAIVTVEFSNCKLALVTVEFSCEEIKLLKVW